MTAIQHPEPLVPAEVDLRDFQYMELDVRTLRDSRFAAQVTGDAFRAGVLLWCAAWHQVPAGSVPDDDVELANLAGYGRFIKEWRKVRAEALTQFVKCSDGRLYHETVAEKAAAAWQSRLQHHYDRARDRLRKANKAREAKSLPPLPDITFEQWNSARLSAGIPPEKAEAFQELPAENALKGRGNGEGEGTERETSLIPPVPPAPPPPAESTVDVSGYQPTPAGAICRALRQAGISDTNPGHPTLQVLLDAGATEAEFLGAVDESRDKGKPFAYLLGVVEGQRKRAAEAATQLHRGAMPTTAASDRRARQLATAALMTGAVRATPQPQPETIDVDAHVVPPRALG